MYILIFTGVFAVLVLFQTGIDRMNFERIGVRELKIDSPVENMDILTLLFRTGLCVLVTFYFVWKNGNEFALNMLILTVLLAGLASKIFFPVIPLVWFSDKCGVYENGIVTLCGTKKFSGLKSYTVQDRINYEIGSSKFRFVFRSRYPYVSRPTYIYVSKKNCSRMEKSLQRHQLEKE